MGFLDALNPISLLGGFVSNIWTDKRQEDQQEFNSAQAAATREYNAQEAARTREFNAEQGNINRAWQGDQALIAREFNQDEANRNREFQDKMSSTAFQRGMADMKAAGLNPIMAFNKGGASAPSGSMASTSAPSGSSVSGPAASASSASSSFSPASDFLTPAVNTALAATKQKEEVKNLIDTNANIRAQAVNINADTALKLAGASKTEAETYNVREINQQLLREAAKSRHDEEFYNTPFGKKWRQIGTAIHEVNPLAGTIQRRSGN